MFSSHSALYRRAAPALQEHLLAAQSHLRVLLTEQTSLRRARQAIGESQWLAPERWQALVHTDDWPRVNAAVADHLAGHSSHIECELRMRHRHGNWVWVLCRGQVMRQDSDGKPLLIAGIHLDITARKQVELALRDSEERYRSLSETDSLTGLYNSRHLHEQLPAEIERTRRYLHPLSLFVLDCDNFKAVNDKHGHLGGDRVLQNLALSIRQCLRRSDFAFRYGGEEFVVVLPETDGLAAMTIAERLRTLFAAVKTLAPSGETIHCTVSIGISVCHPGDDETSLIRRADEACYRAKQAGKNRVILADSAR